MRPFSKQELIGVTLIFIVVLTLTLLGLRDSVRRSRDVQRKADIGAISNALNKFQEEFGYYPPSVDGKIKMCKAETFAEVFAEIQESEVLDRELFESGLRACEYGLDAFRDVTDDSYPAYMEVIPTDPKAKEGLAYLYISNTRRFQIYSYLEGESEEDEYNPNIVARNLYCGNEICSFGKSSGDTPLDISIEEYEQQLLEKTKSGNP